MWIIDTSFFKLVDFFKKCYLLKRSKHNFHVKRLLKVSFFCEKNLSNLEVLHNRMDILDKKNTYLRIIITDVGMVLSILDLSRPEGNLWRLVPMHVASSHVSKKLLLACQLATVLQEKCFFFSLFFHEKTQYSPPSLTAHLAGLLCSSRLAVCTYISCE